MATKREQLMAQRAEEADRMISDLQAPVGDSPAEVDLAGAPEGEQPTIATGDEPLEAPPQQPAVSGDELQVLKTQVAQLTADLSTANQRYSTLQGMLAARNEDITTLRGIIATLGTQPAQPEPTALVTDKDKESFGEDLIDLIQRVTKQQVAPLLSDVNTRVDGVAQVAAATAEERFEGELTRLVPDWEQINNSPEFVSWLGRYNIKALNEAYGSQDLQGTAQFFNDFKKLTAPPANEAPPAAPAAPVVDKLAQYAAPPKGKVSNLPIDESKGRIWTPGDVKKLYDDMANKRITPAEFDKLEADLFKAQREERYAA